MLDQIILSSKISAIDLFCGVGGMTHGLIKAGIPVIAGIDIDKTLRYIYEKNNATQFINKDVRDLCSTDINKLYPKNNIKLLVGCAPCQPFSKHTRKYKNRGKDEKWRLLYDFSRLIKDIMPDIVSMENVPEIINQDVFADFVINLNELGFNVSWKKVYCPDFGIPQTRTRLVLLASKLGKIELIQRTHNSRQYRTVRKTIKNLPPIYAGEINTKDPLHRALKLSLKNIMRIRQSIPGGTWHDWDENLRCPCHNKASGKNYQSVYGRMEWNKPSPTITTQFYTYGTGRFGHPEQDRALSLREGALLQTFPNYYNFIDPNSELSMARIGSYIGNAVPVLLAKAVGLSIISHLQKLQYDL